MTARKSDDKEFMESLQPNFTKSEAKKDKESGENMMDKAASYIPGNSKPRDALDPDAADPNLTKDTGRQGLGSIPNAMKPSGEQSYTDMLKQKADQLGSQVQPQENKSNFQAAKDYVVPGNASGQNTGQGVVDQVTGMATGAKDAVVNMFSGEGTKPEQR